MTDQHPIFIVFDDREFTNDTSRAFVGDRRYSEIIFRRRSLLQYFMDKLADVDLHYFVHLRNRHDVTVLRKKIEDSDGVAALFIVSSRAGIVSDGRFEQLLARLPYAEDSFCDRVYKPLLAFFKDSKELVPKWESFHREPLHCWENPWELQLLSSVLPLDLGRTRDFLSFMTGSTETRHFNKVEIDTYYYTKKSTDKRKMEAEYRFYSLVPEKMRPWLIQPFEFVSEQQNASYKMIRYYLADAALQWVHNAFNPHSFEEFIDRLLFFIQERPRKSVAKEEVVSAAEDLFIAKVDSRVDQLLELPEGAKVNQMLEVANPKLEIRAQVARYKKLYEKYRKHFALDYMACGHGDPCFSNVLYDQKRNLMKLIDPKGAIEEPAIWTHPYYDLCKISHSVTGNYDFINNGLYQLCVSNGRNIELQINDFNHEQMQQLFLDRLKAAGYDWRVVRLAEASLFLSMLPLHIDHPNKVMAFMLTANNILDEVENGRN